MDEERLNDLLRLGPEVDCPNMPVMGGLEATQLIRAREAAGQRTPIIGVTANAREEDKVQCMEAGMDDALL